MLVCLSAGKEECCEFPRLRRLSVRVTDRMRAHVRSAVS